MQNELLYFFENALQKCLNKDVKVIEYHSISGGCINNTARLNTSARPFFIKWNEVNKGDLFSAEAKGLQMLYNTKTISIPEVIGFGKLETKTFLILEFIESQLPGTQFWEELGSSLSELHKITNNCYGLDHDNYIGSLHQKNGFTTSWVQFFIENRLDIQIELAYHKGYISESFIKKFKNIYQKLPDILPEEKPSLLHGDLWSGNFLARSNGKACLIDPAVYFGNREVEIAFTKLFGGFDLQFYKVYNDCFPMLPGFDQRVEIYNLYYLLVHVNLFGTSYLAPVERTVKSLQ